MFFCCIWSFGGQFIGWLFSSCCWCYQPFIRNGLRFWQEGCRFVLAILRVSVRYEVVGVSWWALWSLVLCALVRDMGAGAEAYPAADDRLALSA